MTDSCCEGERSGKRTRAWALALLASVAIPVFAQDPPLTPAIIISGGNPELQANVLASLPVRNEPCTTDLVRLQRQLPDIRRQIDMAATALGYYHLTSETTFTRGDACWQMEVALTPGSRVALDDVVISVDAPVEVQEHFLDLLDETTLRSGVPLHHGDYERFKRSLTTRAVDRGFLGAIFTTSQIALDLVEDQADITLIFTPGPQFLFGALDIRKSDALSDELIDRLINVDQDDGYSTTALAAVQRRLEGSQYFDSVRMTPRFDTSAQRVPVQVDLNLRPRHAWSGGLGFATDTGPRARVQYENRYVNPRGHRAQASTVVSTVQTQVDGGYTIPLRDPSRQSLNFAAGYNLEDNDSFESQRLKFETSVRNETSSGLLQTAFLNLQRDDYVVDLQEDVSVLLIPGVSLSKTRADNPIDPQRGWKMFVQLQGASNALLSDTSFMQLYGSAKYILGLGKLRMLTRLEMGATWVNETVQLPASLRYFAGGDQSLRGYDYRALGPLNDRGEVEGGKQITVGSVEFDYRVRDSWRVAVFADSGNAFNDRNDFEFRHSVGFGVRWISPIGPIRVDLAHPIDYEESFRLHVTMGPDL